MGLLEIQWQWKELFSVSCRCFLATSASFLIRRGKGAWAAFSSDVARLEWIH